MVVSREEFMNNFEKLLKILEDEEVLITEEGNVIARLSHPWFENDHKEVSDRLIWKMNI